MHKNEFNKIWTKGTAGILEVKVELTQKPLFRKLV